LPLPQATASQLLAGASGVTADAQAQAEQLLSSFQASTSELTGAASDAAASAVGELAAALCLSSTTRHRSISLINLHDYMERMLLGFWSIPLPNARVGCRLPGALPPPVQQGLAEAKGFAAQLVSQAAANPNTASFLAVPLLGVPSLLWLVSRFGGYKGALAPTEVFNILQVISLNNVSRR